VSWLASGGSRFVANSPLAGLGTTYMWETLETAALGGLGGLLGTALGTIATVATAVARQWTP
jgi:hypothetical protein